MARVAGDASVSGYMGLSGGEGQASLRCVQRANALADDRSGIWRRETIGKN